MATPVCPAMELRYLLLSRYLPDSGAHVPCVQRTQQSLLQCRVHDSRWREGARECVLPPHEAAREDRCAPRAVRGLSLRCLEEAASTEHVQPRGAGRRCFPLIDDLMRPHISSRISSTRLQDRSAHDQRPILSASNWRLTEGRGEGEAALPPASFQVRGC